ncbi:MAG: hypothetical protein D6734_10095 [Candidatus Schekmanbacteria bacterium]|nr:MAG: hypothetical protein D6734_10095 [Candidatus Schekmanbacteria bacterium]
MCHLVRYNLISCSSEEETAYDRQRGVNECFVTEKAGGFLPPDCTGDGGGVRRIVRGYLGEQGIPVHRKVRHRSKLRLTSRLLKAGLRRMILRQYAFTICFVFRDLTVPTKLCGVM